MSVYPADIAPAKLPAVGGAILMSRERVPSHRKTSLHPKVLDSLYVFLGLLVLQMSGTAEKGVSCTLVKATSFLFKDKCPKLSVANICGEYSG